MGDLGCPDVSLFVKGDCRGSGSRLTQMHGVVIALLLPWLDGAILRISRQFHEYEIFRQYNTQ